MRFGEIYKLMSQKNELVILLDNGHGNNTPGKRSPVWGDGSQLFEWEFTRAIVNLIRDELLHTRIKSLIVVPEAIDIPLRVRVTRVNRLAEMSPGAILLSIHGNAGNAPNEGSGWEAWTSPGETESDKIANHLYAAAKNNLTGFRIRTDFSDADPDKESKFTMLTGTTCPAVLTENLFYDNEVECRFMASEKGKELIAWTHIEGILNYLKTL
jgi:N-acetylmuramoyl-L-alanine amidase